jgi:hypothetical protein
MAQVHARHILIKQKSTGVDALVDIILSGKPEDKEIKELYEKAKTIFLSPIKKSYVEACLMASKDLEKIQALIETPIPLLQMYRDVFFDVESLDKLSLMEVIESAADSSEKGMKIWALSQGLDFVAWRLGRAVNINPVDGLQELFTLAVFKSKEALFSGNASETSKAAANWTKLSMDLARILKAWVSDSDAARSDIELALKSINPEFAGFDSIEQSVF